MYRACLSAFGMFSFCDFPKEALHELRRSLKVDVLIRRGQLVFHPTAWKEHWRSLVKLDLGLLHMLKYPGGHGFAYLSSMLHHLDIMVDCNLPVPAFELQLEFLKLFLYLECRARAGHDTCVPSLAINTS